ncbi:MAG TPA: hypothetical protein VMZ30_13145 [Pyrinomonadaceae bacterium]|nr:hypothetical protein [Pyrinomonadaceae bacterium]
MSRLFSSDVRLGALAATAIVFLSLAPQIHFWLVRGRDWQGAYATLQGDEFLYSAYINALIDGRPRRNDPFAGRDNTPAAPLPESTFSIQFIPAFAIAGLARVCHLSASSAFVALHAVAGLLASLSLYWLLTSITGNSKLSAVGVMFVLCFGALAGGQGIIGLALKPGVVFLGLPFLRRYQPAADLPLFFIFCALVWQAVNAEQKRRAWLFSIFAGLTLAVLIFSYLYLWTAAATWLGCLALLWLYLRPQETRRRALSLFLIILAIAIFALVPYLYFVSQRASSLDQAQTLVSTHRPDLFRAPEIIGLVILVLLVMAVRRRKAKKSDTRLVFAASFALLPLVLFNQQIVTGRSMQPYHFETFVVNYAVLIGLVIVTMVFRHSIRQRALLSIAMLCFLWGAVEVSMPVLANYGSNLAADQMVPVLRRLKELSKQDGTLSDLRDQGRGQLVFSPERDVMGLLPTWTPQGTLLGMGVLDFGSASQQERKEMFYLYLYYSGADANRLRELLNEKSPDTFMNHYARTAIFGHERVVPMLSFHFEPIRPQEIDEEVRAYQAYVDSFAREKVLLHPLTYAVIKGESDLSHLELWYERDAGERFGEYSLYHLKLR